MTISKDKIKIVIIGCGAITEESYLPAADQLSNVDVVHVVDLDIDRAKNVAESYNVSGYSDNYHEVFDRVDAAIVATPPSSHARIAIDCLNQGIHVLCEKPLATSVEEAKNMVEAGKRGQVHFAVGMVRRLNWSSQYLKKLVANNILGDIHSFDVEEGWIFNWPLRTGHMFSDKNSRGVVADTGPHIIDLILWVADSQKAKIVNCYDDNWGGIEANAILKLEIEQNDRMIEGRIELSFTRRLRNTIKIFGKNGCLEASTVATNEIFFYPHGDDIPIVLKPKNEIPVINNEDFCLQLKNFTDSIIDDSKNYVSAEEAIATMELIDDFYLLRKPTSQKWDEIHIEALLNNKKGNN